MKTMLKTLTLIALAALMIVTLVSCDKSDAIKKAFEKEGYEISTVDSENTLIKGLLTAVLDEEQMEALSEYELILASKSLTNFALIVKFPGSGDLKDFLTVEDEDGKKDTSIYDNAKEEDRINGNCWILTPNSDAKEIFKKA